MPKDKAELDNQQKSKSNHGSTTQRSQASKLKSDEKIKKARELSTKSEEKIKSTRERSTERSNLKKETVPKANSSIKRTESVNLKSREIVKSRPTPRNVTNSVRLSKSVPKISETQKTNSTSSTPRTNVSKPMKALKTSSSSSSVLSSQRSTTSISSKGTKSSARDTASSRVTKQQYFPKKFPFSAHLHDGDQEKIDRKVKNTKEEKMKSETTRSSKIKEAKLPIETTPKKLSRERTMTRILSPHEVKVVKNIVQEKNEVTNIASTLNDDRPRTATIRKHTENNINPNMTDQSRNVNLSNSELNNTVQQPVAETSYQDEYNDYEDDFESYESDFEAYSSSNSTSDRSSNIETDSTSSKSSEGIAEFTQKRTNSAGNEEERKLDSGNYDLPDVKHKQILDKIKEAIERENSDLTRHISKVDVPSSMASLSDEGFEDSSKLSLTNNGFINFADAKKKRQQKKINLKSRKRGEDLMNMIRLDTISFTLYDMTPISYEDFMQSYGRTGTVQISSQTGDDDLDEEIQTETIEVLNKWTQYPVRFSKYQHDEGTSHVDEQLGVGNDPPIPKTQNGWSKQNTSNAKKLAKFLETSGKLMLNILEQRSTRKLQKTNKNKRDIPFSEGYFKLNIDDAPFLKNRAVSSLTYSKSSMLLTVHKSSIQDNMSQDEHLLSRSAICIWNLLEPMHPQHILMSCGEITKACFDNNHGLLVFAGVHDGTLSVWDLRESANLHKKIREETTGQSYITRAPTYTTIYNSKENEEYSTFKIIAIQPLYTVFSKISDNISSKQNTSATQVCTLNEIGTVTIWSVIQRQNTPELLSEDPGLIPWGCIVLVQGLTISLQSLNPELKELQCFDLQTSEQESNHLYIATNYGVLHCLTSGMKPKPKIYSSQADKSTINCIEICPFSASHFLTGCENGNIRLYSRFYEKSLMTLCNSDEENKLDEKIQIIEWSNSRPCVFFIKDSANNLHIWDLSESDMYPIYSIPFKENITDIKVSPSMSRGTDLSYMAISTDNGEVFLHTISKDFSQHLPDRHKDELNKFLNYVNRL